MAKSLAIENLNNLGINLTPGIVVNYVVILTFLRQLASVGRNMS